MKKAIATLATTLLAAGAYAQNASAPAAAPAEPSAAAATKHEAHVEEQIRRLHKQLQITSAQEDQWSKVAGAMRDNAQKLDALFEQRRQSAASMTAVDDLKSYGDIAQAHADGVKALETVFEPLYASMSDEQKKVADNVFRRHAAEKARHEAHRHAAPKTAPQEPAASSTQP